jgi:uncharacterized membrane protein
VRPSTSDADRATGRVSGVGEALHKPVNTSDTARWRRTVLTGVLLGVGLAGTLDEVILHQILHWHHFYDRSSSAAGLVSNGLFHPASTMFLVAGAYRLWIDRAQPYRGWLRSLLAGVLLGLGGFNLYDGTVQHKLLHLHQVRPDAENWLPYDIAFIGVAAALLLAGIIILWTGATRDQRHSA